MRGTQAALWLARTPEGSWRCRTSGEAPGPSTAWEPIADPFGHASADASDPATLAGEADALGPARTLVGLRLLPPCSPQKVFGIGRNYRAHAHELGNEVPTTPLCFLKAPSCLIVSGDALALPRGYERIDMEAELVVVVGQRARAVAAADAWQHVAGYLLGNDVSCRDLQHRDKQWTRAKGLDGFGPVSPFMRLVAPGWSLPVSELEILGYLDDVPVQRGWVADMIFSIPALIEHLSEGMTLEPGDLIFTGTPAGVAALSPGQVVRVELAGLDLGRLVTPIT
ncbi:fumarylacetoacetate hydrolase family protein [Enhygromyxa salina]|uniref:Homoprotocatechuate catabolism bifunctional isomerase/decarboxylase n=1 Tax=Enhygromyxa salina TaxID=215803 RepID=A0A2S9YTM6_9BACT|nr:fumarylacetoacetate hydrolase family protein [Enhygromyxa salina]PRQ08443.1 Homoprotocatechuate catabolism bifunctional isomerase/decarboxylase [Enhygromyxa salina]